MGLLARSDLTFTYTWKADEGDNAKITGFPDNKLLDRNEGYEVLPFINRYAEQHQLRQKTSGLKIERMIRTHLPGNTRSHKNIKEWITENWGKYQ